MPEQSRGAGRTAHQSQVIVGLTVAVAVQAIRVDLIGQYLQPCHRREFPPPRVNGEAEPTRSFPYFLGIDTLAPDCESGPLLN